MQCGCDCGSLAPPSFIGPPVPVEFPGVLEIIAAANIVAGWDAADLAATPVASWPDASGNGFTLVQAVGASQPVWSATAGANGNPSVRFDGVSDLVTNALLDLPAPTALAPVWYWAVLRQHSWTLDDRFCSAQLATNARMALTQNAVTPQVAQQDNSPVNPVSLPLAIYKRLRAEFTASVADNMTIGATTATGVSAGVIDATAGFALGAAVNATSHCDCEMCEFWIFKGILTSGQLAALDLYAAFRYGSAVIA